MAPTLVASYYLENNSGPGSNSPLVTPSFTPADGEVIVVKLETWGTTDAMGAPVGGSQTYTSRAIVAPGGFRPWAGIYTATISGGPGSMTVSSTPATVSRNSMTVERWSSAQLAGSPAVGSNNAGSGSANGSLTSVGTGSVVSWVAADAQSLDPSTRAYLSSATEEGVRNGFVGANGCAYYAWQAAAAPGSQAFGLSAPTGMQYCIAGIEIQDGAAPAAPAVAQQPPVRIPPHLLRILLARYARQWTGAVPAGGVAEPDLVVANASHLHAAQNVTLVQNSTLVVQNASSAHTASNVALVQQHTLTVANAASAHTAQNVALVQQHTLVVANASQAHTASNVVLAPVIPLVPANASHAHTAGNVTLTQQHTLTVQNASSAHTANNIVLTQAHSLAANNAAQAHTASNVTLTQAHVLTVSKANQLHTASTVTLTQVHNLVVSKANMLHTAGNVVLSSATILTVANANQLHTASNVTLVQQHVLVVSKANQLHTAGNVALIQQHVLVVQKATQLHTAANVVLSPVYLLVVQKASHAQTATHVTLSSGVISILARVRIDGAWVEVESVGAVRVNGAWVAFGPEEPPWTAVASPGSVKTRVGGVWVDSTMSS